MLFLNWEKKRYHHRMLFWLNVNWALVILIHASMMKSAMSCWEVSNLSNNKCFPDCADQDSSKCSLLRWSGTDSNTLLKVLTTKVENIRINKCSCKNLYDSQYVIICHNGLRGVKWSQNVGTKINKLLRISRSTSSRRRTPIWRRRSTIGRTSWSRQKHLTESFKFRRLSEVSFKNNYTRSYFHHSN